MRVVRTWNGVLTMQATDPVCQRSIPLETVEAHREFLGWSYFFCSAQCVRRFDQRPEKYIDRQQGGPPAHIAQP